MYYISLLTNKFENIPTSPHDSIKMTQNGKKQHHSQR